MDPTTEYYVSEEHRLMRAVLARQRRLMAEDVRLSPEAALSRAIRQMPNNYRRYAETRATLARLGVAPTLFKDL